MITSRQILEAFPINERNMYDVDEIDDWLEYLARDQEIDEIKTWLQTRFRKYIINDCPFANLITEVPEFAPSWLSDALERGEEVYTIDISSDSALRNLVTKLMDFLEEICPSREFYKFIKLPIGDLIQRYAAYQTKRLKIDGIELEHKYSDGFKWVRLLTRDAIENDGEELANCLRIHTYLSTMAVIRGEEIYYSLRDPNDHAKAMMNFYPKRNEFGEIRGLANGEVPEKYRTYCIDFLNRKGFRDIDLDELKNINAVEQDGTYVSREEE
jgi:hypothetical protein